MTTLAFRGLRAAAMIASLAAGTPALAQPAPRGPDARGEYLARIMDCGGCHTSGAMAGRPDPAMHLAGSGIGFGIPEVGVFYPPNLTPDRETGLGDWSEADIMRAVRTGVRPDGRVLAPVMPWHAYSALNDADARALARYLRSLPPVRHAVPAMVGASETPTAPYLAVVVPGAAPPAR